MKFMIDATAYPIKETIMNHLSTRITLGLALAALFAYGQLQTIHAQDKPSFEFMHMELKVTPQNEASLVSFLEESSMSLPGQVKVTLGEKVFSPTSATHELVFSSQDGDILADLMSGENQPARTKFMHALKGLVEIQKTVRGVRLFHFGGNSSSPDTKQSTSYYGYWSVQSRGHEKTSQMFLTFAKDFADLRKANAVGLGQHVAGASSMTHYYLHTFSSYRDYVDTYNAYMSSEAFQKHSQLKQSFETPVENGLIRILRQWT